MLYRIYFSVMPTKDFSMSLEKNARRNRRNQERQRSLWVIIEGMKICFCNMFFCYNSVTAPPIQSQSAGAGPSHIQLPDPIQPQTISQILDGSPIPLTPTPGLQHSNFSKI